MSDLFNAEHFSIRAALSRGFRVISRNRRAGFGLILQDVGVWLVLMLAYSTFVTWFFDAASAATAAASNPASLGISILGLLGFMVVCVVVMLMQDGAWYRFLTGKQVPGIPAYQFGEDEGRLLAFYLIFYALLYGLMILILVGVGVVASLFSIAATGSDATGSGEPVSAVLSLILLLFAYAVYFYMQARLNGGAPLTVTRGRFDIFGGWAATRSHGWRVFGALILVYLFYIAGVSGIMIPLILLLEETPIQVPSITAIPISAWFLLAGLGGVIYLTVLATRGLFAEVAVVQLTREREAAKAASSSKTPPQAEG
jgi:hypothetical protein